MKLILSYFMLAFLPFEGLAFAKAADWRLLCEGVESSHWIKLKAHFDFAGDSIQLLALTRSQGEEASDLQIRSSTAEQDSCRPVRVLVENQQDHTLRYVTISGCSDYSFPREEFNSILTIRKGKLPIGAREDWSNPDNWLFESSDQYLCRFVPKEKQDPTPYEKCMTLRVPYWRNSATCKGSFACAEQFARSDCKDERR